MKKSTKLLTLLLVLLLAISLIAVAACNPPETETEDDSSSTEEEETTSSSLLITNGLFATASSSSTDKETYIKETVSGWTLTGGATSVTSSSTDSYVAGVVDISDQEKFDAQAEKLRPADEEAGTPAGISKPGVAPSTPKTGDKEDDTNVLLLATPGAEGAFYYKLSSAASLEKGKYYVFSIDVYTDLLGAEDGDAKGAYIILNAGEVIKFEAVKSDKTWTTLTAYIEANNFENRTLNVQLWIGHGSDHAGYSSTTANVNPRLTKGVVFFDNVTLTECKASEYTDAEAAGARVMSLIFPDEGFTVVNDYSYTSDYYSTIKYFYGPKQGIASNYTGVVGKVDLEDSTNFPTTYNATSVGGTVGIVDIAQLYEGDTDILNKLISSVTSPAKDSRYNGRADLEGAAEQKALMIYHPNGAISGYGVQSNYDLLIEKNTSYEISVWVYFWAPDYSKIETEPTTELSPVLVEPNAEDPKYAGEEGQAQYTTDKKNYDEYQEYLTNHNTWETNKANYDAACEKAYATFKMTGVSVEGKDTLVEKSETGMNVWKQITIKVQGSDLVDRQVGLEFWYGEGEWESETLFPGGCFFDNLTIKKTSGGEGYKKISPLVAGEDGDYEFFGLMGDATTVPNGWEVELADEGYDEGMVALNILEGSDTFQINGKNCNIIKLENIDYTASVLTFGKPNGGSEKSTDMTINKNAFYRLGMWVKTENVADDLGAEVCVMYAEDDSEVTCFDSVNTDGEFVELTYYFRGAVFTSKDIYLQVNFGSGSIYTPTSHIKGSFYVTALTWQEISYDEYSDADTSKDYVTSKALDDGISTSNTLTNGYFGLLNTSNYSADDTSKVFDENGTLIGVAIPNSWTATAATTNHLSAYNTSNTEKFVPLNLAIDKDSGTLSWTKVDDATCYYVFIGPVKTADNKTIDKVLIGTTDACSFVVPNYTGDTKDLKFYVQAYNGTVADGKQVGLSGFSSDCSYVKPTTGAEVGIPTATADGLLKEAENQITSEFGIIDYTTYTGAFESAVNGLYAAEGSDGIYYKSVQSTGVLMMSSNYYTNGGYKSSSKSVSSGTYAKLSVWVKTTKGTTASVTISNSSSVFAASEDNQKDFIDNGTNKDYIGFVDIDTEGKWQQVTFFIKNESPSSATIYLELWFGNKYAEDTKTEGEKARTIHNGLTKGTVFFDDVTYTTFADADEFAAATEGKTANTYYQLKEFDNEYYSNKTIFQILDYTVDSFDETSAADEDDLGNEPDSYTHSVAGEDYNDALEEGETQTMLYGVFNKDNFNGNALETIKNSKINENGEMGEGYSDEAVKEFLTKDGFGKNVLVMANLDSNGQAYYSSTFSISNDSYYKVTFWAKAWVEDGKAAEFRFMYGNSSDSEYSSIRIASKDWQEYTFYVSNKSGSSVSSNKIYFYLGSDDDKDGTIEDPTNFFKGFVVIDNVSVIKLANSTDFDAANKDYAALDDAGKLAAKYAAYTFEEEEEDEDTDTDKDAEDEDTDTEEETESSISSQVWLLIASVVIGAVILAVVIVFAVRKIKKKFKIAPAPVESKVPVNLANPAEKKSTTKKDINEDDGYTD